MLYTFTLLSDFNKVYNGKL